LSFVTGPPPEPRAPLASGPGPHDVDSDDHDVGANLAPAPGTRPGSTLERGALRSNPQWLRGAQQWSPVNLPSHPVTVATLARQARDAAPALAQASTTLKNRALTAMATALMDHQDAILAANARDLEGARHAVEAGTLAASFLDRLALDAGRLGKMAEALRQVVVLPDPVGTTDEEWLRPNGLRVGRRRIPLGVIGFIYEARPNVTSDAAGLCLKSGNAVVLKGGRHALSSNRAVVAALHAAMESVGLPAAGVQFIDQTEREAVLELLRQEDSIDLIIPRGGESLIRFVAEHSRIPVIKHYKGVCHVYADASADPAKLVPIVVNAKAQRPGVCNAAETLLIHSGELAGLLGAVGPALLEAGVTLHLDGRALEAAAAQPWFDAARCIPATEDDLYAEYLSLDLAVAVVDSLEDAVAHIRRYGSEHTEAIVTEHYGRARAFLDQVNSSCVLVNASTRFADGGELGLGAEIGISTTKLHAFGPMGLRELTTTKFVVFGDGQVRA